MDQQVCLSVGAGRVSWVRQDSSRTFGWIAGLGDQVDVAVPFGWVAPRVEVPVLEGQEVGLESVQEVQLV